MAKKTTKNVDKMPKDFSLIKQIREEKDYKSNVKRRDKNSRKFIGQNCFQKSDSAIVPGSLIMFNYLYPKTEDQLEYYDAMPCTIFFNKIKTKAGEPRVLGWNCHMYPPKIRWQIMNRIMEIFKNIYKQDWNGVNKEIAYFDYHMLVYQLQKAKLDFGVRMYIPELITNVYPVPPKYWSKALLTEGHFRKQTREAILNYWKNHPVNSALNSRATANGLKTTP